MQLVQLRNVVTDGRQSSAAEPNVISPRERGPYKFCDEVVEDHRLCKADVVQVAIYRGESRTWALGYCLAHRNEPIPAGAK